MKLDSVENILRSHWLAVARSRDLGCAPLGIEVLGKRVVLGRFSDKIAAFEDRCPHRNVPLSKGCLTTGYLKCAYHGWEFDVRGKCRNVPGLLGKAPDISLSQYRVCIHENILWINLSNTATPANLPALSPGDGDTIVWDRTIRGSLEAILENFLDGTHTHYVHRGLVRVDKERKIVRIEVKKWDTGAEIRYIGEGKQNGLISKIFEGNRTESFGRFLMPSIGQVEYRSPRGVELIVSVCLTPVAEELVKCLVHIHTPRRVLPAWMKQVMAKLLFGKVLDQDVRIVEQQADNIAYFGGGQFATTEIDVMRPLIRELWFGECPSEFPEAIAL